METELCPYLISCDVEDIRQHVCGDFKECEIYQINELFREAYGSIGVNRTYAPIKRFTLEDL